MILYNWQPGNGTRYLVGIHQVNAEEARLVAVSPGGWIVFFPDGLFKSYAFQPGGSLDNGYVASKLDISLGGDLVAIMQLLSHIMGRPIRDKPWPKCIKCGLPIHPDLKRRPMCFTCEFTLLNSFARDVCKCGEPRWRHGTDGSCLEESCSCLKFQEARP